MNLKSKINSYIFATSKAVSVLPHRGPPIKIIFTGVSLWAIVNSFNTEGKFLGILIVEEEEEDEGRAGINLDVKKIFEDINRILGSFKISVRTFVEVVMLPIISTGISLKRLQLHPCELDSTSLILSTIG